MISRSSGCAATPRCDVRVVAPGAGEPSGVKISLPIFLSFSSMLLSLSKDSLPFRNRQAGGGHGLADAAAFLVGEMERQTLCQVGELCLQDLAGFLQDDRARLALLPGLPAETEHGLLGEILDAAAGVSRPFVHGRSRAQVDGDESQLVEPAGDIALFIYIPARLAPPKR